MTTNMFGVANPVDFDLLTAAYNGEEGLIARALAGGAAANVTSSNGWTALMWLSMRSAVAFAPVPSAARLLAAGADINCVASSGSNGLSDTPLSLACEAGYGAYVAFLLENGADPNPPDPIYPPLHAALPSPEIVAVLLRAGAGRQRRFKGQTPWERYEEGWGDPEYRDDEAYLAMETLLR